MTEEEKSLYNIHLSVSRSCKNLPYNKRINFDNFEEEPNYIYLKKLGLFFERYKHINPYFYFKAPYVVYPDQDFFKLEFYTTQKAIKTYTLFNQLRMEQSPDTEDQIQFIKDSLRFIGMYCVTNNISLDKYITYKPSTTYVWMQHLKDNKVSIYCLLNFQDISNIIESVPNDEKYFLLNPELIKNINTYKGRLNNSQKAKYVVKEGFKRIENLINNYIKTA